MVMMSCAFKHPQSRGTACLWNGLNRYPLPAVGGVQMQLGACGDRPDPGSDGRSCGARQPDDDVIGRCGQAGIVAGVRAGAVAQGPGPELPEGVTPEVKPNPARRH